MRRWARYWLGRYWLSGGFCPACNSSPPDQSCFVCDGSYAYGRDASATTRSLWRRRWNARPVS